MEERAAITQLAAITQAMLQRVARDGLWEQWDSLTRHANRALADVGAETVRPDGGTDDDGPDSRDFPTYGNTII